MCFLSSFQATTEEELDALIKKVEYELEHVTLSLKEEKEHIAQLKRLKQQRPRIQTFALQHQLWEAKNNATEVVKGDQDQLEKEHKVTLDLFEQYQIIAHTKLTGGWVLKLGT